MLVFCAAMAWSPSANAAERLEAGIRLIRPDGVEVVLDTERLLLDRGEVANIVVLVRDLEACREAWADCEKAPPPTPVRSRGWVFATGVLAAFALGMAVGEAADSVGDDI